MTPPFVSMVVDAKSTEPKAASVIAILNDIRDGKYRQAVEHIRREYGIAVAAGLDGKEAVRSHKKRLPGVLFSGRFSVRRADALVEHSGLLCADLDELGGRLTEIRSSLECDPHVYAVFTSPTGTGLKAIYRVQANGEQHRESFYAVRKRVKGLRDAVLDESCKDVSRLCFVN